jgi:hypothetical protein
MPAELNLEIAALCKRIVTARWVRGQLWNCSDSLPSYLCGDLGIPGGSSYALAVRSLDMWHRQRRGRQSSSKRCAG